MSFYEEVDRDRLINCLEQINKNLERINNNLAELAENSLDWQEIEGIQNAIEELKEK